MQTFSLELHGYFVGGRAVIREVLDDGIFGKDPSRELVILKGLD